MTSTHSLWQFIRREPVLSISFVCALVSAFFVPPSAAYVDYIDLRVLCLLFCLMAVVAGLQECGLFCWPESGRCGLFLSLSSCCPSSAPCW